MRYIDTEFAPTFLIALLVSQITSPLVMSTKESTSEEMIDSEPDR